MLLDLSNLNDLLILSIIVNFKNPTNLSITRKISLLIPSSQASFALILSVHLKHVSSLKIDIHFVTDNNPIFF